MQFVAHIAAAVALALATIYAPLVVAQDTCDTLCTPGAENACPLNLTCTEFTIPLNILPDCQGDLSIGVGISPDYIVFPSFRLTRLCSLYSSASRL